MANYLNNQSSKYSFINSSTSENPRLNLLIIFKNILIKTLSQTMKLDIIHHNVRHWGHYKNGFLNYYLQHNSDIITLNSHGLNTNNKYYI